MEQLGLTKCCFYWTPLHNIFLGTKGLFQGSKIFLSLLTKILTNHRTLQKLMKYYVKMKDLAFVVLLDDDKHSIERRVLIFLVCFRESKECNY